MDLCGQLIAVGGQDKLITLWSTETSTRLCTFYMYDTIHQLSITPDKQRLVVRTGAKKPTFAVFKVLNTSF